MDAGPVSLPIAKPGLALWLNAAFFQNGQWVVFEYDGFAN